ncbi:ribosomal-protein-alanine N-acetyltransferase [Acinetobacter marinus]|uniref:[Ribosomal protein bS18]-alanine N-acetyltransferase n=1 Tax=Acinetobacter marinus TaxID=281375 RepID=A0A1G6IVD0_9GAMM|nr:ribosomal protein S18-alanine N-acetyltransferase [Acinetobacter marinus]SDC10424.1 ribosomal-protein-alanine N-acetyltransferase [Acinetobacter marinus]
MQNSNHPSIQIRTMQDSDINAVCAIEQQVQFHPWTASQFADSVQRYQATIVERDGEILGFCIVQKVLDEANLLLMAIDPKCHGQGLGTLLLNDAIERLGDACVQIFLEVRESNYAAIALYEKVGFHQIDLRKNYYPAPNRQKEHAVIMVNMLSADAFSFHQ